MTTRICHYLFSLLFASSICISAQEPCVPNHPDSFPNVSFKVEKLRLNEAAKTLKASLNKKIYLIAYSKKSGSKLEATKRLEQSKRYLEKKHQISATRIVSIEGGTKLALEMEIFVTDPSVEKQPCYSKLVF